MVDCCMDMELKKVIVPKGVVGYSFDRYACLFMKQSCCVSLKR